MLWLDGLMGKEGKGSYEWLQGEVFKIESHLVTICAGMMC